MSLGKDTLQHVKNPSLTHFRQIGLGRNITLDTITVPTEVVLSRNVPGSVRTRCINISAGK